MQCTDDADAHPRDIAGDLVHHAWTPDGDVTWPDSLSEPEALPDATALAWLPGARERLVAAPPEPQVNPVAVLLDGLAKMREVHSMILDAAAGHRSAAEAAGFSPAVAEQMAHLFYTQIITQAMVQGAQQGGQR